MTGLRIRWPKASAPFDPDAAATDTGTTTVAWLPWFAAGLIVLLAFLARSYNTNWDDNTHLHPDERHMTSVTTELKLRNKPLEYFDTNSSTLNPYNRPGGNSFVYGTLPVFLTKVVAVTLGQDDFDKTVLVGRHLTALFDVATVLLVFLIGRRLYGSAAGLLAAVLFGAAPLAIQHAHFYIVDSYLTFFTTATLYFSLRVWQDRRPADCALAGLMLGLGMACKITAVLVAPVVVIAIVWRLAPLLRYAAQKQRLDRELLQALRPVLLGVGLAAVVAFLAFRVAQPYAFDTPSLSNLAPWSLNQRWLDDQKTQSTLLSGEASFPPSVQWIGRTSYLYPLTEMVRWGMGPAFGVVGWLALAYAAYRLLRKQDSRHLLPLVFALVYFGFMGRQFSLYLRYFLPLYPVLAVLAGYALVEVARGSVAIARKRAEPRLAYAGYAVVAGVVVLSLLAGLAYLSVYTKPLTRIEASRWMYENLPARSQIAVEHWDESVPMGFAGAPDKQFQLFDLELYEPDTPEKVGKLIDGLSRADYVTLSSNRLLNSIPRNQVTYPVASRYYELLLSEQLGFRLLREFTSYPRLLGLEFADHRAQESFSSYDHPRVLVFEKTSDFSRQALQDKLGRGPFTMAALSPAQADRNGLLLRPADLRTQQRGGTWSSVFSDSGIVKSAPTLVWLLAIEAAALAVLPIVFLVCRRLPDRGYLLSKPLGLLLVAYPVWLGASLKLFHFDQTVLLVSLAALVAVGAVIIKRHRDAMFTFIRENWRLILVSELLFLLAFFVFREIRLANPDLWHPYRGGEKPMDLAYLTAVARSTTLPPYDPWFAGGYINYYYFGQYLTASLLKLTTIPPEVGYNLAVPTFFAMTVGGAFSISYGLAASVRSALRRAPGWRPVPGWSLYAAGLLGAFLVAVAGNLDGVDQLFDRLGAVTKWRVDTPLPVVDPVLNAAGGLWQAVVHGARLEPFDFWRSSRMLPPSIAITEFPYFSFLFADLHAHMMALPFEVLALGLCLSLALSKPGESSDRRDWAVVVLLGLLVGALRWLNSWDYPPFLLLSIASLAISERHLDGGAMATTRRLGAKALALVALSFLLFKPFLDSYITPVAGLHASPETTPIRQYAAHFGVFLALSGGWLLFLLGRALKASPIRSSASPERSQIWVSIAALECFVVALLSLVLFWRGYHLVAVLLPFLCLVIYLAIRELRQRRPDAGPRLFVLMLVALALGLSMGVDFVTLDGDIERMNTVFKFYEHVWIAFALAAAFAAWYFVWVLWLPALSLQLPSRRLRRGFVAAGVAALAAMLMAVLIYPSFATKPRLDDRFAKLPRTLDGIAYMRDAVYADERGQIRLGSDYQGIEWLRANVRGTPAIVEGRTPLYRWGGRFSIYTGLPTVLGWDWHQTQQRGKLAFMIDQRAQAVDAFYGSPDVENARRFLRQYGVEYVIVGQVERMYYPAAGLAKLDSGLGGALDLVFENRDLRIYRVTDAELRAER
ncbi:MAG TPA: DUF2298 domain-containing protein [Dehalococcoidia bacterium]|nr:DUF2298 domain-containing protein [Dehalococcoidia bacterium]